jgi:CheY-like chemotaxis protein
MGKEPLTTRLDADTKQEVENYADERDIGQTEAARRLIRSGLAAEGHAVTTADGGPEAKTLLERLASPLTVIIGGALLAFATGLMTAAGLLASNGTLTAAVVALGLSTVIMALATGTVVTAALAQLALARPLRGLVFDADVEESETA